MSTNGIYDDFYHACRNGMYEEVERLITEKNVDVNCRFLDGNTPLTLSTFHAKFEVCDMLLDHKAEVDSHDTIGWTPLSIAARNGDVDLCWLMIDRGADINAQQDQHDGWTALHFATASVHEGAVEFLVENGAFVDMQDNNSTTALDIAKMNQNETSKRIVSILERSSNSRLDDLWKAYSYGNMQEVKRLMSMGKKYFSRMLHYKPPSSCRSCLMIAIESGHMNICEYLLSHGANIQNEYDNIGRSCLMVAAERGSVEICTLLLVNGASMEPCRLKLDGGHVQYTCLMKAIENGHLEVCKYLVTNGADIHNDRDKDGKSCLMVAAERGHVEICKYLLENGVDIGPCTFAEATMNSFDPSSNVLDEVRRYNSSAFHLAARNNRIDVVKLFLELGVDPFYYMVLWVAGRQYKNFEPFGPRKVLPFKTQEYPQPVETVLKAAMIQKDKEEVLNAVKHVGWLKQYISIPMQRNEEVLSLSLNDCGPFSHTDMIKWEMSIVAPGDFLRELERFHRRYEARRLQRFQRWEDEPEPTMERNVALVSEHFLPYKHAPPNCNDDNARMAAWYMRYDMDVCIAAVMQDERALEAVPNESQAQVYGLYLQRIGYKTLFDNNGGRFLRRNNEWQVDRIFRKMSFL